MKERSQVHEEIKRLTDQIARLQRHDGSWRFCFENGTVTDACMIIILRTLEIADDSLIRLLHDRLLSTQHADGFWKVYEDEQDGNLSATVECVYALLYSGFSRATDRSIVEAKRYILSKGGLHNCGSILTKSILAATGQYPWPDSIQIPIEFVLLPPSSPISLYDFSGYARMHFIPILLLADRQFAKKTARSPDLSDLFDAPSRDGPETSRGLLTLIEKIKNSIKGLADLPQDLHKTAIKRAETFMLERIEPDGTLYSYATCTFLMILALQAIGYSNRHPIITHAVQGLTDMLCRTEGTVTLQNSPSAVWDTALLSYALQETGIPVTSPMIRGASSYLLTKQQNKYGDWSVHNPNTLPGGWGFSESNTINPDVDDTTAALRAIHRLAGTDASFRKSWNRGLNWVLSMQNRDGGWPAFEKDANLELLTWLPLKEAKAAAVDPSTADLTGRTLEYLGNKAGLRMRHPFIRRGTDWLIAHQEEDGSWYGRWGVCYIYGTWAAVTGLSAVGMSTDHSALQRATEWLLKIQNPDGGWGESCKSDQSMRYIPLGASTPSQTAWALDALIAAHFEPIPEIKRGIQRLTSLMHEEDWQTRYPTGAGLPGIFYSHYHSYRYIWPLLTLGHYQTKYNERDAIS